LLLTAFYFFHLFQAVVNAHHVNSLQTNQRFAVRPEGATQGRGPGLGSRTTMGILIRRL
ncbi:hypothetical protein LYNGBM3L_56830, partial [Moorena producens 3L]